MNKLLQPILARPVEASGAVDHEVVCGERRFRACLALAAKNGGPDNHTILTLVRGISDDDAFDMTIIENLQRQDLNPLEEARSFQQFLDKHGPDTAADLADRVGVSASYVRRRVAVLDLPGPALKAWQKGRMTYGHLEQLRRLNDKKQIARFVAQIVHRADSDNIYEQAMTVRELKREIEMESPSLKTTLFDKKKAGCARCHSNSDVQKKLFDTDDSERLKCLNPKCYKQNVNNHLSSHWEKDFKPQYGTNGFVFSSAVTWSDYELIEGRGRAACKKCDKFVSLVEQDGSVRVKRVCIGGKDCHRNTYQSKSGSGASEKQAEQTKAETRVRNHGIEFREQFYKTALPDRFKSLDPGNEKVLRGTLLAFYVSDWTHAEWIREKLAIQEQWEPEIIHQALFQLPPDQARAMLQDLAVHILMRQAGPAGRRVLADHIGIDLSGEWAVTEAYLKKKTIQELIAMGNNLDIFTNDQVQTYAAAEFGHTRFDKLKKADLMDVYLKSGIELTGKVPAEIPAE